MGADMDPVPAPKSWEPKSTLKISSRQVKMATGQRRETVDSGPAAAR